MRPCEDMANTEKSKRPLNGSTPGARWLSREWMYCPFHNKTTQKEGKSWDGKEDCESKSKVNKLIRIEPLLCVWHYAINFICIILSNPQKTPRSLESNQKILGSNEEPK